MLKRLTLTCTLMAGSALAAPDPADVVAQVVLPAFDNFVQEASGLDAAAQAHCNSDDAELRRAWGEAFDAWMRVSHLRFGPTEADDRAFALAFWPDSRGVTPKTLQRLIAEADPVVQDADAFAEVSVAARGFYAMEFLLYDDAFAAQGDYTCALTQAMTHDIAKIAQDIRADWTNFAEEFDQTGGRYRNDAEALQELYKAVLGGLQFTSDVRLGRPMGDFDAPRPARAEARRSERSLRHVALSLEGTRTLALALAADHPEIAQSIEDAYAAAFAEIDAQDSPVFAGVTDPMGRFRVEVLQRAIDTIRYTIGTELGPKLGVVEGFNALDGD
ncbi:imelysin family protein [Sagittula sp. SSi028]|uniref:imelysin family protein n=1 Tax=Sagittula sp. SSi028 TaxID=3400636 RepID=UPI003AF59891